MYNPWIETDFIISPAFNLSMSIDDSSDGLVNGFVDVFQGDMIILQDVAHLHDFVDNQYSWEIRCLDTGFTTTHSGAVTMGEVGKDFLYKGEEDGIPLSIEPNSKRYDYEIFLNVTNGLESREKNLTIRVHPYASYTFERTIPMGTELREASVTLIWRGFLKEVAPSPSYITPEKPIHVFIKEVPGPVPDLDQAGGIGLVYNITAVGCKLQDGTPGFIEAEIKLPILTSELEEIGYSFQLMHQLMLERYNKSNGKFYPVAGSYVSSESGLKYVVGTVNSFSIFTSIVDSIYNSSHPDHNAVIPDLDVKNIELSRSPVLNGQEIEIRVLISNSGMSHARNVDVHFYFRDTMIGYQTIPIIGASGTDHPITHRYTTNLSDTTPQFVECEIKVVVNEFETIKEPPTGRDNNQETIFVSVVNPKYTPPPPSIRSPESGETVNGRIKIHGRISGVNDYELTLEQYSYRQNDYIWFVEEISPDSIPVFGAYYYIYDGDGTRIEGLEGYVEEIYGLNFDDFQTNLSFIDNDKDSNISKGDAFKVKHFSPFAWIPEEHTIKLEFGKLERVEISIDGGEWILASGTDYWHYKWDTTGYEDGEHIIRVRSHDHGINSNELEITVNVDNERTLLDIVTYYGLIVTLAVLIVMLITISRAVLKK